MGFRFHRVLNVIPGVRVNLSKSGLSGSLGPRGAEMNIGRHGVTTNAGIPGTGLSYRSKLGGHGGKLGILAVVVALGFAAFRNGDRIAALFSHPASSVAAATRTLSASRSTLAADTVANAAVPAGVTRYVHRGGSDLRDAPSTSAAILKKESKGTQVALLATSGKWVQVRDGEIIGWMRASVLGAAPPQ